MKKASLDKQTDIIGKNKIRTGQSKKIKHISVFKQRRPNCDIVSGISVPILIIFHTDEMSKLMQKFPMSAVITLVLFFSVADVAVMLSRAESSS